DGVIARLINLIKAAVKVVELLRGGVGIAADALRVDVRGALDLANAAVDECRLTAVRLCDRNRATESIEPGEVRKVCRSSRLLILGHLAPAAQCVIDRPLACPADHSGSCRRQCAALQNETAKAVVLKCHLWCTAGCRCL